ncbi:hypothetical protein VNO77_44734 [Canavalia gladiata]|uniref:Uncharacterized protein n=1 Tax=Canavalia gladiata TaxID=3824 RepID=A0AAN9JX81_CANGL
MSLAGLEARVEGLQILWPATGATWPYMTWVTIIIPIYARGQQRPFSFLMSHISSSWICVFPLFLHIVNFPLACFHTLYLFPFVRSFYELGLKVPKSDAVGTLRTRLKSEYNGGAVTDTLILCRGSGDQMAKPHFPMTIRHYWMS